MTADLPLSVSSRFPEISTLLQNLLSGAGRVLAQNFLGMYLDGSLATGDFDLASDIDFLVVTREEVDEGVFLRLQEMHDRLAASDPPWAIQLEGSYISRGGLRRYDPARATHPNIERGAGERLKMVHHDADWVIHRHVLREFGIPLAGPGLQTLIDPIHPDDLRRAMRSILFGWWAQLPENPGRIARRGYQAYAVLTFCRILYTLEYGKTASKRDAANWVQTVLDPRWSALIDRAWTARLAPDGDASAVDVRETLDFLRFVIARTPADGSGSG
jgi:hypothetical protein